MHFRVFPMTIINVARVYPTFRPGGDNRVSPSILSAFTNQYRNQSYFFHTCRMCGQCITPKRTLMKRKNNLDFLPFTFSGDLSEINIFAGLCADFFLKFNSFHLTNHPYEVFWASRRFFDDTHTHTHTSNHARRSRWVRFTGC